jgi:hypothetical protein
VIQDHPSFTNALICDSYHEDYNEILYIYIDFWGKNNIKQGRIQDFKFEGGCS